VEDEPAVKRARPS